ncbi:hypothetical protein NA56DRAFT_577881 [Hyaloscypha hepaticicola]|uniref:ABM domain-containing protein n=1 Tax=Hyaloscypha hepaticicola TaxID=2082293 RepID=A0A2J6PVU9_9HELO|nr:hypothetical protein NA56DRAFT_577881 [Hyaloscypha hepaticicola]
MIPVPKVSCILQIKMIVKSGHRETWLALFKQIFNHVSQEPECAYFIVGEDEPGVFRWMEGWTKDKEWVNDVQLEKPYYEPYFKATAPLLIQSESKLQIKILH